MENKDVALFIEKFIESVHNQTFIKLTLSKSKTVSEWTNLYVRLIHIKNTPKLSITFRYKTRDEVKNYDTTEGGALLQQQLGHIFLNAVLITADADFFLVFNKKGENPSLTVKRHLTDAAAQQINELVIQTHNKEKKRLLDPSQVYFRALDIADSKGVVTPTGQKKFKQINKYIEIIDALLKEMRLPNDCVIADFGSGKGYLTFALYDHLFNHLKMTPSVCGFELRENLTNFCNALAEKCHFDGLTFIAQDIINYQTERLDMLIALHACDTATDIAIAKGIKAGAKIIVVAPCCHKQIRKQLAAKNEMQPILKHGIMAERQAELLTDGIRALLMEAHGYKTKVFEFISTEHTPKNVMIVGIKHQPNKEALNQVENIKQHYGIEYHALEKLIG